MVVFYGIKLAKNRDAMKKAVGTCLALVFAGLLGLCLADKSVAGFAPPPAPTNSAPVSINGPVSDNSGLTSQP
jgi:hypothetical protein